MDAVKGAWASIVATKRAYLNPHEHFGRANICRAALLSYVGIFCYFKMRSANKAKALAAEKAAAKKVVAADALARAGLA